jgi:hypothetical protein
MRGIGAQHGTDNPSSQTEQLDHGQTPRNPVSSAVFVHNGSESNGKLRSIRLQSDQDAIWDTLVERFDHDAKRKRAMSKLCSLHMPPEIRQDLLVKEANFDVPNTAEGVRFTLWWDTARDHEKRAVLRRAHEENVSVMDAKTQLETVTIPDLG